MQARKITINHYEIETETLSATIKMNPRDAMVGVTVTKLPADEKDQQVALAELQQYLTDEVGGKILLQLPVGVKDDALPVAKVVQHVMYSDMAAIQSAMQAIAQKEKVQKQLARIDDNNGEEKPSLQLFSKPVDYKNRYKQLFSFKITEATFVTSVKRKQGLYSEKAEQLKVENEFVRQFTLYDTEKNAIVANLQTFIHGDLVYLADFIVKDSERKKGLAYTIMCRAFTALSQEFQNIRGIWYVAGGDGKNAVGQHLYADILRSVEMSSDKLKELGLRNLFGPAKKLLLQAGNRRLHDGNCMDLPPLPVMQLTIAPPVETGHSKPSCEPQQADITPTR